MQPILSLLVFVALVAAAAFTGSYFRPGTWYERLEKPSWNPPKWLFPVAWTILYAMIAVAGWLAWRAAGPGEAAAPLGLWLLQLVLNAAWSPAFFGLRRPGVALVVVVALWLAILATIVAFLEVDVPAALLMVPYLVWVSYAAALNAWIWRRNPDAHPMAGG